MKADVGERADEIEQHAEADRVGRDQLTVAEMREHLPPGGEQALRAHEFTLRRQQECDCAGAGKGDPGEREKSPAPADQVGEEAGHQPAAESAQARARTVDAGGRGRFLARPFVADIGDGDREDRRQHQALHRAPEDERRQARRQSHHHRRHRQRKHRRHDHPLAPQHVGHRAGEGRSQRHRQRADRDDGGNLGCACVEFAREQRQDRLRRIKVDEAAIAGEPDRQVTRGNSSAFGGSIH